MTPPDPLRTCLLDILFELRDTDVRPLLAGGYGLFLKQLHLQQQETPTLIPADAWPAPRATNDLDVVLQAEIVADSRSMGELATILHRLGFVVRESYKYMQFRRLMGGNREVKVDLLVGPLGAHFDQARVTVHDRRVKPKPSVNLHAHRTDEAIAIEDDPTVIPTSGVLSSGADYSTTVLVPQAFPYLMMKLLAFRDHERKERGSDKARCHALDLYRVVAMMTHAEFTRSKALRDAHKDNPLVIDAASVVREAFADDVAAGTIRLREHPHFAAHMDLDEFIATLGEIFSTPATR
jgi:hypothetical protein